MAAKLEAQAMLDAAKDEESVSEDENMDGKSVESEKCEKGIDYSSLGMDALKAELLSLTRQLGAVKDLADPRSQKLKTFLAGEVTQ
eukprot:512089-Karenia_brevis.AAC.1